MHTAQHIKSFLSDYQADDDLEEIHRVNQKVATNGIIDVRELNGFFWGGSRDTFLMNRSKYLFRTCAFDPINANFLNDLEFQARLRGMNPPGWIVLAANTFVFHDRNVSQGRAEQSLIPRSMVFRAR